MLFFYYYKKSFNVLTTQKNIDRINDGREISMLKKIYLKKQYDLIDKKLKKFKTIDFKNKKISHFLKNNNNLHKTIIAHNKIIISLTEELNDVILKNPLSKLTLRLQEYSFDDISKIYALVTKIEKFSIDKEEKHYKEYFLKIKEIYNNYYSIIKKRIDLKLINFEDRYYDSDDERNIILCDNKNKKILIDFHNKEFIDGHLNLKLFDDVLGKKLDNEQRKAILCDAKNTLVIAGAGSGKTLTICGKVKYLLENNICTTKEILLLSYSNASVNDLFNKINKINNNLTVKTFHALAFEIYNSYWHKKTTVEPNKNDSLKRIIINKINNDDVFLHLLVNFIGFYYFDFVYASFNKKDNVSVFSFDFEFQNECTLANYLFLKNIKFLYRKMRKRNIFISCFNLKNDNLTIRYVKFYKNYDYNKIKNTKDLLIYDFEFENNTAFFKLDNYLAKHNLKLNHEELKKEKEYMTYIFKTNVFEHFCNRIITFFNLYEANFSSLSALDNLRNLECSNEYLKIRRELLFDIVKTCYISYKEQLKKNNKIDFDEMIFAATRVVKELNNYKYRYVIVDEFQDISQSRVNFLKALIEHGNAKLFAVGDDWQSIYRFAGSDINLFINFSDYFFNAKTSFLTTTYRNSKELINAAEKFITKNPYQLFKSINSVISLKKPIKIFKSTNENKSHVMNKILSKIYHLSKTAEILILGRNNFDYKKYFDLNDLVMLDEDIVTSKKYPSLKIKYLTVHRSKGLESDYVVLINADDNLFGFPNQIEDDETIKLLLSKQNDYLYDEERRLFYVALTRTKKIVYVVTSKNNPSIFINEMKEYL